MAMSQLKYIVEDLGALQMNEKIIKTLTKQGIQPPLWCSLKFRKSAINTEYKSVHCFDIIWTKPNIYTERTGYKTKLSTWSQAAIFCDRFGRAWQKPSLEIENTWALIHPFPPSCLRKRGNCLLAMLYLHSNHENNFLRKNMQSTFKANHEHKLNTKCILCFTSTGQVGPVFASSPCTLQATNSSNTQFPLSEKSLAPSVQCSYPQLPSTRSSAHPAHLSSWHGTSWLQICSVLASVSSALVFELLAWHLKMHRALNKESDAVWAALSQQPRVFRVTGPEKAILEKMLPPHDLILS